MGSALIAMGLEPGRQPEEWLLDHPERILATHRAFVAAGSDIIQTHTFGANPARLATSERLAGRCRELNELAVRLAREAAGSEVLVAGNIGPTGLWPQSGDGELSIAEQTFAEQATALREAGADLISIETMCDLGEAQAAVQAAVATGLPVIASVACAEVDSGFRTLAGDRVDFALQRLRAAGATAVGCNCNLDSGQMLRLGRQILEATELPLVLQPCAGQPRETPDGLRYPASPGAFARDQQAALQAGVSMVGGCCGTTPAFIAALRASSAGWL